MINIDTVYQKVLAIANKEQRGYITPQEFNLFANKAQMDIFEKTFYDYKTALKFPLKNLDNVNNDIEMLREKILPFNIFNAQVDRVTGVINTKEDVYWLASVYDITNGTIFEEHDRHTFLNITNSPDNIGFNIRTSPTKIKPTTSRPVYYRVSEKVISFSPKPSDTIKCDFIRKPIDPKWGYVVVGGKAMYNAAGAFNFELHPSEESSLVNRILELSGISLNKPGLADVALRNEATNEAAKK
jgi:hypothetical protein